MIFVNVDVPMERVPVANWVLIALTCLISFGVFVKEHRARRDFDPSDIDPEVMQRLIDPNLSEKERKQLIIEAARQSNIAFIGALDPNNFSVKQLITYQFVHGDFWHLLGNMFFLFCFGNAINAKLGHVQFLALYLLLGVFAGFGWLAIGNGLPLIGASGAIAGINGVFLVLYPMNETSVHTPYSYMSTGDAWRMPSWSFVLFYMAFDLWGTLADRRGGVGYACHLAGELAGVMIASGLVLAGLIVSNRGETNLMEYFGWVKEAPAPVRRRRKKPARRRIIEDEE